MWIKVCGTTSLADAQMAIDAGADALGFVFAPSPRQVTPAAVRAITEQVPARTERYGVFVDPTFDHVVETVEAAGLSGVQLHSTRDAELATRLRTHFAGIPGRRRLGLTRVLHFSENFAAQLEAFEGDHSVDAVLIDSRTATAQGGTGIRFDWAAASGSFLKAAPHLRLIVAGGLSPENVANAITTLKPWGVDVVSGVEAVPGRKDREKVRSFVKRARGAAELLKI